MKIELGAALAFVILHHFVVAHDYNHLGKCPEYNPQNELDVDLVRALTAALTKKVLECDKKLFIDNFHHHSCEP